MIDIKNITKVYNGVTVLNIPDLKINKGESFGLVGNNGAGKTTLFRCILDMIRPNTGEIISEGHSVSKTSAWKSFTGSYLDEGFVIDFLTPEEYFSFLANINGLSKDDLSEFLKDFEDFFNGEVLGKRKYIRDFSSGNQKKVGIAAALISKPDVLILDEPFNSLDPTTQIRLKNLLKKLDEETNTTMLISSHDLSHVTEVCKRIVVLHEGNIAHDIKTESGTLKVLEEYFAV